MNTLLNILLHSWSILLESSIFILFGLLASGLLRVFLSPGMVSAHLGKGRFRSVLKASLLGIPIPLCSCGVLPAGRGPQKTGGQQRCRDLVSHLHPGIGNRFNRHYLCPHGPDHDGHSTGGGLCYRLLPPVSPKTSWAKPIPCTPCCRTFPVRWMALLRRPKLRP